MRRRRPQRRFTAGQCPFTCQGLLQVWVTRRGRPVVLCDECESTWFHPTDVAEETAVVPEPSDFALPDGDFVDHPASWEEIKAAGWAEYVDSPP